jgi:lipoprotein-releasing system permease protein
MNPLLPFEWIAAVRFLKEGRAQTVLTVVGASVGVAVVVFMSALLLAVQANIFTRILSTQPHIAISPPKDEARPLRDPRMAGEIATIQAPAQKLRSIDQWQKIRALLQSIPDVTVVSPSVSGAAFAVRGDASKAITLSGIESEPFYKIVNLPEKIISGSARLTANDMLVGSQLAINLGVGLGEKIHIRSATGIDEIYTISGIFDLGNRGANERSVFVPLRAAQNLLGLQGGANALDINVVDPMAAESMAVRMAAETGLQADSWIKTFDQLFTSLRTQTAANRAIQFFVGLAVALGIASVLVVSVVQRSKEIGILRAMGASRGQILRIFLLQGAIVGLLGSVVGSALGAGFVQLWRIFARNPDGTPFFVITLAPGLFLIAGLVATLTGLLAALMPAISASRLNPVEAIRG